MHAARRSVGRTLGLCGGMLWMVSNAHAQGVAGGPAALIPADKGVSAAQIARLKERGDPRVYRGAELETIGMPCGGICAGQLYVLGDGSLGCWQIDGRHHFTGVGHDCYRTVRPAQPVHQAFSIAVGAVGGARHGAMLNRQGYDAIEFVGEYPRALVRYRAERDPVPEVAVDLEVFSPFVPLQARDSGWPATVLRFTLQNRTPDPVTLELTGWLENDVFAEFGEAVTIERRNRAVLGDGVTTLLMDAVERPLPKPEGPACTRVLGDFESGTYDGWTVTGEAFGARPSAGTHARQNPVSGFGGQHLVNSYADPGLDGPTGRMTSVAFEIDLPWLVYRIGGGNHPGKTCLNLVVDGRVVRTDTGRNAERLELRAWDVREFLGRTAQLEIVDEATESWGHVNVDDLALTNDRPAELHEYRMDRASFGSMALSVLGDAHASAGPGYEVAGRSDEARSAFEAQLVGMIMKELTLPAHGTEDVTFIVSWYFPNLHNGHQRMYAEAFADARDVVRRLAPRLAALRSETLQFCAAYYERSTLPRWLSTRLMMPVSTLATGTVQWWADGRFWAWEGVGCCGGTCTHVWNYAQAHAWLFPELARSVRTLQDLGEGFEETTGLVGFRSNRAFAADGQAGTVLKFYREHLVGADDAFLRKHWRGIQLALEYLISHDADADGVIANDRQHNTYDINFVGPNTFIGALYLAALRAGEEMARRMGDEAAAQRYHGIFERGRQWVADALFNGEYYEQQLPAGDASDWQYATGCLSDQVFGQNWAHLLGLGPILPAEQVRAALASVFRCNWTGDVGPYNAAYPPERVFARPGEPGLLVCTWPRGGRPEAPVRYRDEVWTGIEYQVAAGLIWEGLTDEGLLIIDGINRRYDPARHNPWNEVECGDHYARALASWSVLHALCGFTLDGPAGRLAMSPRLTPDDHESFFCVGSAWGNLAQQRGLQSQANSVHVVAGALQLRELVLELPEQVRIVRVEAYRGPGEAPHDRRQDLDAGFRQDGTRCTVTLEDPVTIARDEVLWVTLLW